MSFVIFGFFFAALWLLVELLSILLKLTGLELNKARFQVISILTHTGFTTRESELIVQHPTRRKIASVLMIISYVSQATLISMLFEVFSNDQKSTLEMFLAIIAVFALISLVSKSKYMLGRFDRVAEKWLSKSMKNSRGHKIDKILNLSPEFSIYELIIDEKSPLCNKTLREASLKEKYIQILKIDRGAETLDFPTAETMILQGDKMVVYGKISAISQCILNQNRTEKERVGAEE